MCGRYTLTLVWEELVMRFMLDMNPGHYLPRYNVAPGQAIPAIIGGTPAQGQASVPNRFGELKWGLVPSWSSGEVKGSPRPINARSETVTDKPSFRGLLTRKRCLIPADGFYEWKSEGGGKQPVRFVLKDGEPFGMAALYDTWLGADGTKLHTCAILTTAANGLVAEVHDRMPVILTPESERIWLDRRVQRESDLLPLLQAYPAARMRYYPVHPRVGRAQYEAADCIEPLVSGQ